MLTVVLNVGCVGWHMRWLTCKSLDRYRSIGSPKKYRPLPPLPTSGCLASNFTLSNITSDTLWYNESAAMFGNITESNDYIPSQGIPQLTGLEHIYSISYIWLPFIGMVVTIVFGLVTSIIFRNRNDETFVKEQMLIHWNLFRSLTELFSL